MGLDPILQKFRGKFLEEAQGLLDRLEKDLLDLERNPEDKELIESAFRAMHTIKGTSSMYGFDNISEFTHLVENIYQAIREKKLTFNKEIFDFTFNSVDHIHKLLSDEDLTNKHNKKNHSKLLKYAAGLVGSLDKNTTAKNNNGITVSDVNPDLKTFHILLHTNEKQYDRGISLFAIFQDLAKLGEYRIEKLNLADSADFESWNIFLTTTASEDSVKEVFLFIEDDCFIIPVATGDLLANATNINEKGKQNKEISILDYIEDCQNPGNNGLEEVENKEVIQESSKRDIHAVKRISVDSSKLDYLMYLVSELITVNSQLNSTTRSSQYKHIKPFLEKVDNLSKSFRNVTLDLRLVPLSDMVLRFQRLIRDLSKQLDKKIEFVTSGIDTELDKNTIDHLAEPLMHIIRNCIDHGIEPEGCRIERGKPPTGIIKLSAYQSSNYVFIIIQDDGNGIDKEKVRRKALDMGLIKDSDQLQCKDLYNLIFLPGFSTAQSLSEVSGRGVGMDVVKKRITELKGEVLIESEPGKGTTFTIKLHQSMAIIDTLLFQVGNCYFTVPISDIEICRQISAVEVESNRHTATLPYKDDLIPFVDLRYLLNISGVFPEDSRAIIINKNQRQFAILTDRIVGEHQAVLKPLGSAFQDQNYIASASQLGDGNIAFLIDINMLINNL
jgi:two-component system chemotaxis sensor kinase CheA